MPWKRGLEPTKFNKSQFTLVLICTCAFLPASSIAGSPQQIVQQIRNFRAQPGLNSNQNTVVQVTRFSSTPTPTLAPVGYIPTTPSVTPAPTPTPTPTSILLSGFPSSPTPTPTPSYPPIPPLPEDVLNFSSASLSADFQQFDNQHSNFTVECSNSQDVETWTSTVRSFCALESYSILQLISLGEEQSSLCCELIARIQYCFCGGMDVGFDLIEQRGVKLWNGMCGYDEYNCADLYKISQESAYFFYDKQPFSTNQTFESLYEAIEKNSSMSIFWQGFDQVINQFDQKQMPQDYMVFAFSDFAFEQFIHNLSSEYPLLQKTVNEVFSYHVVENMRIDPTDDFGEVMLITLSGDELIMKKQSDSPNFVLYSETDGLMHGANVTGYQVYQEGILYFIDSVLKPPGFFHQS